MKLLSLIICWILYECIESRRATEMERIQDWHDRGEVWPPQWQEESEAYRLHMKQREEEIMQIPGADERWENWMQFVSGRMVPKFTSRGFDIIHTPVKLHERLRKAVMDAVEDFDNIRFEGLTGAIYGDLPPKFVDIGTLAWDTVEELRELHEQWIGGIELRPTSAYGVRLYQNGSSLAMHYDKIRTHVISSIIHIAHDYDNDDEPWPIEIEDHDGNLHAVSLQPGEMLFYESAKCLHGRRSILHGKYYGSIFIHYQPVDKSIWDYSVEQVIANVPPHWADNIFEQYGSRWAGQAITTDSRVADGAPPRYLNVDPDKRDAKEPPPRSDDESEDL